MAHRIGQSAPDFSLHSHDGREIRLRDFRGSKNVVLAFFPNAWTPVCTSQIPSYQAALNRFEKLDTQVLAISTDPVPTLKAWAESLGGISYPILSDFYPHGEAARRFGVLRKDGTTERAIFAIDKRGVIRYVDVHDIHQQPNNDVLFAELVKIEPERAAAALAPEMAVPEPEADVIMYTTPWCPDSKLAREWLKTRGIEYAEVDISRNRAAAAKVREWGGGVEVTPTFRIRGEVVVDFNQSKLEQLLVQPHKEVS